jgi:signal transduction histidine kinase
MALPHLHLHLRIGQRLAVGYGLVIALLIVMTLLSIALLGKLSATTGDALQEKYPNTQMVNEVIGELGELARAMRNTLIMTEPAQVRQQLEDISRAKQRLAATMRQLNQRIMDPSGREILQQIDIIRSAYIVNQEEFIDLVRQRRMGEAKNLLLVDLHPYQNDFFAALDKLLQHQSALMDQASRDVERSYQFARNVMLALAALAALLSVAVTWQISRSLLRQLGGEPDYATEIAHQIAAGDLSSGITINPNDHASLLFAMKAMRDNLAERSAALQKLNSELAASVETLNRTQEDLVRSEKLAALGALVAGVAHELNTPIGNSLLAASSLVDHTRDFTASCEHGVKRSALEAHIADVNRAGDILLRNLSRAVDLVSSFKQVAVDRQSSQSRQFNLADVVGEILLTLWPTLKKTGIEVRHDVPRDIVMNSYPGPLGQVLTNLVNNAVIHGFDGRKGGCIRLNVRHLEDGWIEMQVCDDGAGIAPENLKRIFDPFFTTRLGLGGSGLGLNIVYNIVHGVLGGRITVRSTPGNGSCFVLTLPVIAIMLRG